MNAVPGQSQRKPSAAGRVRRDADRKLPAAGPRVVIGVGGSADSVAALLWATREAGRRGAVLHIVSAWEDSDPRPGSACPAAAQTAARRLDRALRHVLREELRPHRIACAATEGEPGKVLLNTARGADLLVLGTGREGNGHVPGPIGRYCLQHAHVPVVFVPGPVRA
jgi:nucleotide-binding universal stress UspA family protein